jgi:hypothetical protein
MIAKLKAIAPVGGFIQVASRDSHPDGWTGPNGVSELQYRVGDRRVSRGPYYRLWIAPLNWQGQPPVSGGAARLGANQCFQFFDEVTDSQGLWPNSRAATIEALGIRSNP